MATKDPLAKIFGSVGRVKIMRLFLVKQSSCLLIDDVKRQTKTITPTVKKELELLTKVGLLKKTKCTINEVKRLKKTNKTITKIKPGYTLNTKFEYLQPLRALLTQVSNEQDEDLKKRIRKTGRIKGLIVSGVFLQDDNSKVDILIVGDSIKHRVLESAIRSSEAELGQDLRYAVFTTNEFKYRLNMRDRLISEVLDSPHKKLLNRLGL